MVSPQTVSPAVSPEERLKQRLSGISNLPTPPLVFTQISKLINDPNTSVKDVAAIMSEDAAMSAKVLRLSNSAFYGARSEINTIKQAVLVLGLDAVKSLVLSSSVFDMFKSHRLDAEFQENYWRHSLATAIAGRIVAKFQKARTGSDPEAAFSAGLLHDIGKLIICCFMPDDHKRIMQYITEEGLSDCEAEARVVGYDHTLVGRMLAANWKLPQSIQAAIEFHHAPHLDGEEEDQYSPIIHLADYLAHRTFEKRILNIEGQSYLLPIVSEQMSLTEEVLDALCHQLVDEYSRSSTFMQMAISV
jgi:putative nucleotidyltransferase with HDIG domain